MARLCTRRACVVCLCLASFCRLGFVGGPLGALLRAGLVAVVCAGVIVLGVVFWLVCPLVSVVLVMDGYLLL